MPCDTWIKPNQTLAQRAVEIDQALESLEQKIQAGSVKIVIDKRTGALAFSNWKKDDRDGVSDVCAYRVLTSRGSPILRMANVPRSDALRKRASLCLIPTSPRKETDMPYTIRLYDPVRLDVAVTLVLTLQAGIKESRFTADFSEPVFELASKKCSESWLITVRSVRLREGKPYCGQHPGECFLDRKKKKMRLLEWDDWVEFHDIINDVLDEAKVKADVWSVPGELLDHGKRMWVRRGNKRRVKYEYETRPSELRDFTDRVWNSGSPDQFAS